MKDLRILKSKTDALRELAKMSKGTIPEQVKDVLKEMGMTEQELSDAEKPKKGK